MRVAKYKNEFYLIEESPNLVSVRPASWDIPVSWIDFLIINEEFVKQVSDERLREIRDKENYVIVRDGSDYEFIEAYLSQIAQANELKHDIEKDCYSYIINDSNFIEEAFKNTRIVERPSFHRIRRTMGFDKFVEEIREKNDLS